MRQFLALDRSNLASAREYRRNHPERPRARIGVQNTNCRCQRALVNIGLPEWQIDTYIELYEAAQAAWAPPSCDCELVTIDQEGVGELVRLAVERGRKTRPALKLGICGEHGGDPVSIAFCESVGLDYVSCSAFRVPIARLAAAQAALGNKAASTA